MDLYASNARSRYRQVYCAFDRVSILKIPQLDASLVDLAPSAYDMIVSSAPPPAQSSSHARNASDTEKLGLLPADATVKSAWMRSKTNAESPLSPRAQGKQPMSPHESFVLLQDSMIRNIPTQSPAAQQSKRSLMKRKGKQAASPTPDPPTVDHPNPSPLSHHLRSTTRLFNALSSRSDIDHPLCAECTQILLSHLQRQLDETKKERDGYLAFDKELRKERERDSQHTLVKEEAEKKIEKLKVEERLAVEQLLEAEREREQLDHELRLLELEERALEEEENELVLLISRRHFPNNTYRFWRTHNEQLLTLDQQTAQLATLRAAYATDSATLEKLERTNVYNDAFCIGHDGVFGTINGLRLGRVPGVPVSLTSRDAFLS